jgi:hypothetical protein
MIDERGIGDVDLLAVDEGGHGHGTTSANSRGSPS